MVQKCTVYKKMSEKSVFSKASSPEITSQSFPVSCFSRYCTPPELKFDAFNTWNTGKENRHRNICFALLISTLWIFYRANKNSLSYTLWKDIESHWTWHNSTSVEYFDKSIYLRVEQSSWFHSSRFFNGCFVLWLVLSSESSWKLSSFAIPCTTVS